MIYGLYDKAKNVRDMCFDTLLLNFFFFGFEILF